MKNFTNLIFDFDGTLADTMNLVIDAIGSLSKTFNFHELTPEIREKIKSLSLDEICTELKIPRYKIPMLAFLVDRKLNNAKTLPKPFPGIPELLKKLKAQGYNLYILTSNTQAFAEAFLASHDMENIFTKVYSHRDLFQKHIKMKRIIKEIGATNDSVLYFSDMVKDVNVMRKIDVCTAGVTWGFNNRAGFERFSTPYIFDTVEEIAQFFEC